MTTTSTNVVAKIAAVVAGLGLVAMSFAPAAKADTASDTAALIASLQAQIASLQAQMSSTTTTSGSVMFTTDLTLGSTGASVTALQNWLISKGFAISAGATGYFGAQTKAALAAWQAANGVSPAAGYFGPITRAKVNGMVTTTTTTTTTTTGPLAGVGRLTNISTLGNTTSDIKEGDSATNVIGVSADATGGDVAIQRVDVEFDIANSGGSANLDKYVSDVSVYLDGKKLASMNPSNGDKDARNWTLRFAGLNGVIKAGKSGDLYVKVTPVSSIGASEDGDTVSVTLATDSVRAVGSDGISETYVSSTTQSFTVSTVTAGTVTVSAGSNNPKASQIAVSSSTTTGVTLLDFSLKAKNQDLDVNDLAVSLGTSDSLTDVVSTVKLMKGSTVLKSKSVSAGTYGVITFDNLNETISKDATENYSVVVDIRGDSAYADGTTLIASTTLTGWDLADADGATVTPTSVAVGNTMTLTATGISVTKGAFTASTAAGLTGAGDIATFTMPFTVTAGDNDVFVAGAATRGTGNNSGNITYGTTTTSTSGATGMPVASLNVADTVSGDLAGSYYKITANTSRTFTLNVAITATTTGATTAGYVGTIINSIAYGATSGALTSYFTSNLDTFKTNDVYVTKR